MGQLITSELRKITTTSLWWALMIPTVLVTFGWALVGGLLGTAFLDLFGQEVFRDLETILGLDTSKWVVNYFVFARSINIGTIFPLIFGGLAIAGESSNKTLTTTFLTAPNRLYALTAKAIVYVIWGAIFGAVISASAAVGLLISGINSDFAHMPGIGGWIAMVGVGILASILLTLFGVGVGALVRNVAGTIVALVLYFLMIENLVQLFIGGQAPWLIGFLPNGSINGLTGSMAAELFLGAAESVPSEVEDGARWLAGAFGAQAWWASGLIFIGWAAAAFGGGWAVSQTRDIT